MSGSPRSPMLALAVASAGLCLCAPPALGANAGGASFAYNTGTQSVSINAKNSPFSGSALTRVAFTFLAGTTISGAPTGGGSCSATSTQDGACDFNPGKAPGDRAFILVNTNGARPASVAVTLIFADGTSVSVTASECPPIAVTPETLPSATGKSPYSQQLGATGGAEPVTFAHQGVLPQGLTVSSSGLLSGTPITTGTFGFQVLASDANGCGGSRSYSIEVKPEAPSAKPDVAIALRSISRVTSNQEFPSELSGFADLLSDNLVKPGSRHFYGRVKGRLAVTNTGQVTTDAQVRGDLRQDGLALQVTQRDLRGGDCQAIEARPEARVYDFICPNLAPGETREMPFTYAITSAPGAPADPPHAGVLHFKAEVRPVDDTPDDNFISREGVPPVEVQVINGAVSDQDSLPRKVEASKLKGFSGSAGVQAPKASAASPLEKVKKVEVALVRLQDKAKAARAGCLWLRDARARFKLRKPRGGRCDQALWLRAKGTSRWRYRLRKSLPKGSYALYTRSVNAAGFGEEVFSAKLGNRQTFKVT